MANKARAKLILELAAEGVSANEICRTRGMSKHTVKNVLDAAREKGITWEDAQGMSDSEVLEALWPERAEAARAVREPDWDHIHHELARKGVTLKLLWEEYLEGAKADGSAAISYSTFARRYAAYVKARGITSRIEHKPGITGEVDWSGPTMTVIDPVTGEASRAYLFVAALPYSQYTYVEATPDMKERAWLECHAHTFEYWGGVPAVITCDNLLTGVTSHPKQGEPVLNEAYEALGRHFGCAIAPAQVRKPKQKASAEGAVGKIATAVIAKLRDTVFTSFADLNRAIRECLEEYNSRPFQKREGSRKSVFMEEERQFLQPLPLAPYEYAEWVYGRKVAPDFHVAFQTNRYSVPYRLAGKEVDLRVTDTTVEVYDGGSRVAVHPRFPEGARYRYSTDRSHMPPEFAQSEWNDARMRRWAASIGPDTLAVVERIFSQASIKEQAYGPVMAVLGLSKQYGDADLEAACGYALGRASVPRSRFLRSVLASRAWEHGGGTAPSGSGGQDGGYVRGDGYYGKE